MTPSELPPANTPQVELPTHPRPSRDFLLAGKAQFVVENTEKGTTLTVQVRKSKSTEKFFVTARWQNDEWKYVGELNPATGELRRTFKSEFQPTDTVFVGTAWALKKVFHAEPVTAKVRLEHVGRCGRCGKMLRDAESIERGIGPECIKKVRA